MLFFPPAGRLSNPIIGEDGLMQPLRWKRSFELNSVQKLTLICKKEDRVAGGDLATLLAGFGRARARISRALRIPSDYVVHI